MPVAAFKLGTGAPPVIGVAGVSTLMLTVAVVAFGVPNRSAPLPLLANTSIKFVSPVKPLMPVAESFCASIRFERTISVLSINPHVL